jgi:hypothetical protein
MHTRGLVQDRFDPSLVLHVVARNVPTSGVSSTKLNGSPGIYLFATGLRPSVLLMTTKRA